MCWLKLDFCFLCSCYLIHFAWCLWHLGAFPHFTIHRKAGSLSDGSDAAETGITAECRRCYQGSHETQHSPQGRALCWGCHTWLSLLGHLCLSGISSEQLLPNIFQTSLEQSLKVQQQRDEWHLEWQSCCSVLLSEWVKPSCDMLLISTARGTRKLASPWDTYSSSANIPSFSRWSIWGVGQGVCCGCCKVNGHHRMLGGLCQKAPDCWLLPQEQPRELCKIHTGSQDAMESAWLLSFQNQNNYCFNTNTNWLLFLFFFLLPITFA